MPRSLTSILLGAAVVLLAGLTGCKDEKCFVP